jgi:hypothetical protein
VLVRPSAASLHADLAERRLIYHPKTSGTLRRSAVNHRGLSSSAMALAFHANALASPHRHTGAHLSTNSEQTLCQHDAGRAADCWPPRGGGGGRPPPHPPSHPQPRGPPPPPPPPHTHSHPQPRLSEWPVGGATPQGWGARPFFFFSPVQTRLPRELAESLTRAKQPGLVSPGGSDQAQRYHPASLSSESGESLRHMAATL